MRGRGVVRRLAGQALGRSPVVPVGRRAQGAGIGVRTVRSVLELAVRIGEAMLSLGAAAADVTDAIRRIVRAFGLECQVDLTFTAILVSYDAGHGGEPVTVLRVVQTRSADYGRLTRVVELADAVAGPPGRAVRAPSGTTTGSTSGAATGTDEATIEDRVEAAHDRLDAIVTAPHPYRRSLVTLVLAVMAAGVGVLLGGGPLLALVAGATTALIDVVVWYLDRWGFPPFFLQAAGAAVATTVAVLLLAFVPMLPVDPVNLPPALVVASGIVVLLAGLSLVGAAEDAINGFPVTASARVFEVLLLTLGIVVGIGGVLDAARRFGVDLQLVERPADRGPLLLQVAAAAVVAGAWAVASYARPRAALVAAAVGGTAYLLFDGLSRLGLGPAVASAGAALAIGFAGEALSSRLRVPSIVTSVCGIVPLLPGLMIYRGLFALVGEDGIGSGSELLLGAAMVGLGLAAGVTLGELLARQVGAGARRLLLPGHVVTRGRRAGGSRSGPV